MSLPQFFWGVLRHQPLLEIVLGRRVETEPGWLEGFAPYWAQHADYAVLLPAAGARAEGAILRDLRQTDAARLAFFERGFGFDIARLSVETAQGEFLAVEAYKPGLDALARRVNGALQPWDIADWKRHFAAEFEATFTDFMTHIGRKLPTSVAARYSQMMVRGASRVRARSAAPTTRRLGATSADVAVAETREPYARFFSVEEIDVSYRQFDGSMSPKVTRAGFISGDAVTLLPYDPIRDRVLVVEQFRTGPYMRGDPQPWQIEAIAGRIDASETPESAALRETREEAGLTLGRQDLRPVASYYASPGTLSEFLYSYVGLADLPDGTAGVFGLDSEAENIRGHLLQFDAFMALVASGEIGNAPTILTAHWLASNRDRLRAEATLER